MALICSNKEIKEEGILFYGKNGKFVRVSMSFENVSESWPIKQIT
jgi:hypothetical protein